jgi:beta-N-acetylglucosaminidase
VKNKVTVFMVLGTFLLSFFMLPTKPVMGAAFNEDIISVKYQTHVQNVGWQNLIFDGQLSGTTGKALRLEGINISVENPLPGMRIKYKTHVQNVGWQDWVYDGQTSGTVGKSQRLEGIKVMLEGAPANYHIQYQVHVQNLGWQEWCTDGAFAGTEGKSLRLEAIKIRIVKDGSAILGGIGLKYQTHVQNIGWQDYAFDGQMIGTQGQALRVEALKLSAVNAPTGMKIKYQTYVQNIGWQEWVYDGQTAGTTGKSQRLEAIKISLEGAPAGYHVEYQAHVQEIGWQSWACDGEIAGTSGQGLRLEALRIKIVKFDESMSKNCIVNYVNYTNTLDYYINNQYNKGANVDYGSEQVVTYQQLANFMNPINYINDDRGKYMFMKLSYTEGITVEDLNLVLKGKGILENKGQAFLEAGRKNNVNPIYLVAHALLETGNGRSKLANGIFVTQLHTKVDNPPTIVATDVTPQTTYNVFGIGAFDDNANMWGSERAYTEGWFNIDLSIIGGAKWIANSYIASSTYKQDTLYKMKWNFDVLWHEYATDIGWAYKQTVRIKELIDMMKNPVIYFDIPVFKSN